MLLALLPVAGLLALAVWWPAFLPDRQAGQQADQQTAAAIAREAAAEAVTIAPHRALYDLHLADVKSDSGINNAGGQLLFVWGDSCDGWTIEQRLNLAFSYTEGGRQHIQTSLASWEAKDGSDFRFSVRRNVNGKQKEQFEGKAELAANGSGTAHYTLPSGHTVNLAPKTLFPTVHTLQILRAAKAGKTMLTRDVFDGADETGENQITAFIGAPKDVPAPAGLQAAAPQPVGPQSGAASLDHGRGWPVHMAFFAPLDETGGKTAGKTVGDMSGDMAGDTAGDMAGKSSDSADKQEESEAGLPDYEMSMTLLENGVAHDLVIDYGDFTVNATLRAIEPLPQPRC